MSKPCLKPISKASYINIGGFLKWGYPRSSSSFMGFSNIVHLFLGTSLYSNLHLFNPLEIRLWFFGSFFFVVPSIFHGFHSSSPAWLPDVSFRAWKSPMGQAQDGSHGLTAAGFGGPWLPRPLGTVERERAPASRLGAWSGTGLEVGMISSILRRSWVSMGSRGLGLHGIWWDGTCRSCLMGCQWDHEIRISWGFIGFEWDLVGLKEMSMGFWWILMVSQVLRK